LRFCHKGRIVFLSLDGEYSKPGRFFSVQMTEIILRKQLNKFITLRERNLPVWATKLGNQKKHKSRDFFRCGKKNRKISTKKNTKTGGFWTKLSFDFFVRIIPGPFKKNRTVDQMGWVGAAGDNVRMKFAGVGRGWGAVAYTKKDDRNMWGAGGHATGAEGYREEGRVVLGLRVGCWAAAEAPPEPPTPPSPPPSPHLIRIASRRFQQQEIQRGSSVFLRCE